MDHHRNCVCSKCRPYVEPFVKVCVLHNGQISNLSSVEFRKTGTWWVWFTYGKHPKLHSMPLYRWNNLVEWNKS